MSTLDGVSGRPVNVGHECTARQCALGRADKTAMLWVSPRMEVMRVTFGQLDEQSNRFANVLHEVGVGAGEVCAQYLPKAPELFSAILGALKARVVVNTLFANLAEGALAERLADSGATVIVTRRDLLGRLSPIRAGLPRLRWILLVDGEDDSTAGVLGWQRAMDRASPRYATPPTDAATPSVLHYTSGSTGKPKGVLHVHGGLEYQRRTAREVLGLTDRDTYWCTADQAWVTGTTYGVIAPWSLGVTQVHFGGGYDAERWCQVLDGQGVTVWYTAPTALRMLMREPAKLFGKLAFPRLRHICSVGEPLNPEIGVWARSAFGALVYDTWFQTETGAIMIANRPGLEMKPGSMGTPLPGIEAVIVRADGTPAATGEQGALCIKTGWPSMFATYLHAEESYRQKFQHGLYVSGDTAFVDRDGHFWFQGRSDDVINTAGHLVSPFEVESALLELPEVAESGVVAAPDELIFEKVVAFVCLRAPHAPSRELELKLRMHVARRVSSIATPQAVHFVNEIPKNASGKILRRLLRARLTGSDAGDTSTLAR